MLTSCSIPIGYDRKEGDIAELTAASAIVAGQPLKIDVSTWVYDCWAVEKFEVDIDDDDRKVTVKVMQRKPVQFPITKTCGGAIGQFPLSATITLYGRGDYLIVAGNRTAHVTVTD